MTMAGAAVFMARSVPGAPGGFGPGRLALRCAEGPDRNAEASNFMTANSTIIVTIERADIDDATAIRTHWDDRILPKVGDEIDMFWSNEVPQGWDNGTYTVKQLRAGVLDADPKMPRSQPTRLAVMVELVFDEF